MEFVQYPKCKAETTLMILGLTKKFQERLDSKKEDQILKEDPPMSGRFNIGENITNVFEKLESFLKTKTVVGEPMQVGEIILVPFIEFTFGLGTSGGSGIEQKSNQDLGGGTCSGGRISPTAVLVIKSDQVELLPIEKSGGLEKLIDMVPEIVDKVKDPKCSEK
jgi:uncharacterized spore protein YtfJ